MKKYPIVLSCLLVLGLTFNSCIKEESPSKPAYVHVENVFFEADTLSQGSSSSAITDFWISVDGQQLGANTFPATFPVILDPNIARNTIKIYAGIKDNGITNTRAIYPFYAPYTVDVDLVPGKIDTFRPTLSYDTAATIIIVEDFESPNIPIFTDDLDGNPNTFVQHQSTEVFEGNYSGLIVLDSANLECTVASSLKIFGLQSSFAKPVYLELNYKTNSAFQVGIIASNGLSDTQTIYKGGVNPSGGAWKKIYFKLTAEVFQSNALEYSIVFRALKYASVAQPLIYLDNIKFLHY